MNQVIPFIDNIRERFPRTLRLLIIGLLVYLYSLIVLWNHTSDAPDFLNRYSKGYSIVLVFSVIGLILWLIGLVAYRRLEALAMRIPQRWYYGFLIISGLLTFIQWLPSTEGGIKVFLAVSWLLVVVIWTLLRPDHQGFSPRWQLWIMLVCMLMLVPMLLTAVSDRRFRPDDGHWADYASSAFEAGGIYARTWLQEPVLILPGMGWSVAAYGWALENVAFDVHVGRLWNFTAYLLAFAGVGAVTWRLYGRNAAAISMGFSVLSRAFLPSFDYRPDHQLPFAATLIFFTAIQARYTVRRAAWWHFVCGLLATLALQLHAAAIVFAAGLSLYYLLESLFSYYRQRKIRVFGSLIFFGIGAFIGTAFYYVFNVQPVGGVENFLRLLSAISPLPNRFRFLTWNSLLEYLIIVAAFVYIARRHTVADKLFLGLLACVLVGVVLLDSQGYRTHYIALYVIPVGTLLVDGLKTAKQNQSIRTVVISLSLFAVLVGQASGLFINWPAVTNWLRAGELPPFLYQELQSVLPPLVNPDDVVVSTHQLVWTLPHHANLVSFAAEQTAMRRWQLTDPKAVWERVRPTLIVEVENEMHFDPGLLAYMEEQGFQICDTLEVLDTPINLYRTSCS